MSGLEDAIRKALEGAERSDANVRARIYQAARRALDGGLRNQNVTDSKEIARQRRRLDDAITAIEREEVQNMQASRGVPTSVSPDFDHAFAVDRDPPVDFASVDDRIYDAEPSIDVPDETAPRVEFPDAPSLSSEAHSEADFTAGDFSAAPEVETGRLDSDPLSAMSDLSVSSADHQPVDNTISTNGKKRKATKAENPRKRGKARSSAKPPRRRRGRFASGFMVVIVLAFVAFGGWWVFQSGFTMNPQSRDTAVPNPPPRIEAEDFEGASDWTTVFIPGQSGGVTAGSSAHTETVNLNGEQALRITSNAIGDRGAVAFALPRAILSMLENGPVLIEVTAIGPKGGGQAVGIYCADGTIEGCQRHRFTAAAHKDDFVVALTPNGGVIPSQLLVSSDLNGKGAPLDIFAIRARAVQ